MPPKHTSSQQVVRRSSAFSRQVVRQVVRRSLSTPLRPPRPIPPEAIHTMQGSAMLRKQLGTIASSHEAFMGKNGALVSPHAENADSL